jgi:hypothetical protein
MRSALPDRIAGRHPAIGLRDRDRMAAAIVRAIDQQAAHGGSNLTGKVVLPRVFNP